MVSAPAPPPPRVLGDPGVLSSPHLPFGAPVDSDPGDDHLLDRGSYVLSYNPTRNVANWVAWRLRTEDLGDADRTDGFRPDRSLPGGYYQVVPQDYAQSGYDRGHLCPSADRTRSAHDNALTFLMTNVHPQSPALNRGPWRSLEEHTRDLVRRGSDAYVVAGGVFGAATIGRGVAVPAASYKVVVAVARSDGDVVATRDATVVAVTMPNDVSVRGSPWRSFAVTVDDVEARSGYDLLAGLDDKLEAELEARVPLLE